MLPLKENIKKQEAENPEDSCMEHKANCSIISITSYDNYKVSLISWGSPQFSGHVLRKKCGCTRHRMSHFSMSRLWLLECPV